MKGHRLIGWMMMVAVPLLIATMAQGDTHLVQLREQVHVPGPTVVLRELAEIIGPHAEELGDIEIGNAALPGQNRTFQRSLVQSILAREGYTESQVDIKGPRLLRVTTIYQEVNAETVEKSLREFIETNMPWDPTDATIDLMVPSMTTVVPDGDVAIVWRSYPQYRYIGQGAFRGEIHVNGETQKTLVCRANIEAFGPVVVSARDIPRGTVITENDIHIEQRALSSLARGTAEDPADVIGAVARRTIFPDQVITSRHVQARTLVNRHQTVVVEARAGAMIARSQARALSDGGVGDEVRLRNPDSGEEFSGQVREDGVVVVR